MPELELDPLLLETLRTLEEQRVEFVVIGDLARAIHDVGGFVAGIAIVPAPYGRNVERLLGALHELDARLESAAAPGDIDYARVDLRTIAPCSFETRTADVAVDFEPAGTRGYRDLFDDAAPVGLAPGIRPLVASRADVERIERGQASPEPYATLQAAEIRASRGLA